jgi:GNAT superfamily N-acetyltransferase
MEIHDTPTHPPVPAAPLEESVEPAELIAEYRAGPERLERSVAGMSAEQLRLRPIAGKWSTLEVVCHVSDTEQFFADRMKRTLAMSRPLLLGVDGSLYSEPVRYHDRAIEEELALIRLTRLQMARILERVPPEAWDRTAVHSEIGLVTLQQLLLHAVRHLEHHLGFIEEKKKSLAVRSAACNAHEVGRRGDLFVSTDPALLDLPLIHDFLSNRSYWAVGRSLEVVRRSLDHSLCFGLYQDGRQVGFARVVTDRATFAWLCDVFVLEEYRGQGLAKWLMEIVVGYPALQGLRLFLLRTRDAHSLYERYGFRPLAEAIRFMEIYRSDASRADSR